MPSQDVERILNRYNYLHDEKFKEKINSMFNELERKLKEGKSDLSITIPF
jgi:hypothetical protein